MTDNEILDDILRREGGFVDDPDDPGGATNYGITRATLSEYLGRPVSINEVKLMPIETAKSIYRARYFAPFAGLADELRAQAIDIGVNQGVATARKLLKVAQAQSTRPVETQLVVERLKHYAGLVKANPKLAKFLGGWVNRAVEFL